MKTKILSFILFAILLIFTSCGDGTTNSGNSDINDNPQFEKSVLDSITVKTLPTKIQYSVGETLDPTGLVLQGIYIDYFSDGSTQTSKRDIDYNTYKNELAFSPTNLTTEGTNKITVTYNKKSTTFDITVGKSSSNSEYPEWFKPVSIGGSDLYKVYYIDDYAYNEANDFTPEEKVNDYLNQYIDYIKGLTLDKSLTGDIEIDYDKIKDYPKEQRLDLLLGTTGDDTGLIYSEVNGINDACKPAIEKITKNINITKDNQLLDKSIFKLTFRAIDNFIYGKAYDFTNINYTTEKSNIERILGNINQSNSTSYSIYNQDGTIHPEALQRFDQMITKAADRLKIDVNELRKIVNLSFATSGVEGILDKLCPSLGINPETCKNNEMVDVIESVQVSEMTPIAQAKLNKSIFSQDFGRELC